MNFGSAYEMNDDFDYQNYESFIKSINDSYHNFGKSEYIINNNICPEHELYNFTKEHLYDRFIINYLGIKFQCLMTPYNRIKK